MSKKIIKEKKTIKEKKPIKEKIKIKPKLESSRVLPHKIHGKNIHMTNFKLNPNDDNSNVNIEDFINNIKNNERLPDAVSQKESSLLFHWDSLTIEIHSKQYTVSLNQV